jgi:tRNA(Leu) C34 or U34 (ribose-2'-O)-methylase TrmL
MSGALPRVALHTVLVQPAIAGNTGTTARSCLAFGAALHVVAPAFDLRDATRASVGYVRLGAAVAATAPPTAAERDAEAASERRALAQTQLYLYDHVGDWVARGAPPLDLVYAFSKASQRGALSLFDWDVRGDVIARAAARPLRGHGGDLGPPAVVNVGLLFGNESFGLERAWAQLAHSVTSSVFIPMAHGARSLNLGVCTGIALAEAARQMAAGGLLRADGGAGSGGGGPAHAAAEATTDGDGALR